MAGPCESTKRDANIFFLLVDGCSEKVSGGYGTRAPTPRGQTDSASIIPGPQVRLVPLDGEEQGLEVVWEKFVDNCRDKEDQLWGKVRLWGYSPAEDTWETSEKLESRKLLQYCRRVGTRPPPSEAQALAIWAGPPPRGN